MIVVDASSLDEGTLSVGDKVIHVGSKTKRENFGNNFGDGVDKANRPIIRDAFCPILFWQEDHIGRVDPLQVGGV